MHGYDMVGEKAYGTLFSFCSFSVNLKVLFKKPVKLENSDACFSHTIFLCMCV